ncbi:hypothetical protein BB559_002970 [Furculomyces boomerangus]|uniref:Importin N-terminal domain-containing protein n=1 Tax=Furculomyces boomerangus TaxID=61424 RepID=A0A2T9YQE8_9FUNG|nr:hypothetical protein BB559_002970 [Furculomyces boomerangus]
MSSLKQNLLLALNQILTNDPLLTKQAEKLLAELKHQPGFYYNLQDIYLDKSQPESLRLIAAINFKHGVSKYWRKSSLGAIKKEEKDLIRQNLLEMNSANTKIPNIQYNLAISKIIRWDFPNDWPTALQDIVAATEFFINNPETPDKSHREQNMLIVLNLAIKTSCSRVLATERNAFKNFSEKAIHNLYSWYYIYWNQITNDQIYSADTFIKLTFVIKITRRLLSFGFEKPQNSECANSLYTLIFQSLQGLFTFYSNLDLNNSAATSIAKPAFKALTSIGKLYLEFIKYNAVSFIMMPSSVPVLQWYGTFLVSETILQPHMQYGSYSDGDFENSFNKFYLQSMLLIKSVVRNLAYEPESSNEEFANTAIQCSNLIKSSLLTQDFVTKLVSVLVSRYMILTSEELLKWEEEPEEWVVQEEFDLWETDVRTCAQKLFTDLFMENKSLILPSLISFLETPETHNFQQKDALYTAAGLCAIEIGKTVKFSDWLKNYLIYDVQRFEPGSEIIRRRVAWLIGKWISVGLVPENKDICYEILIKLLLPSEPSLVVKLTSILSLKECINDWDFDPNEFTQHLNTFTTQLISLLNDQKVDVSKSIIVNCFSVLVEKMGVSILPQLNLFAQLIPQLWQTVIQTDNFQNNMNQKDPIYQSSILTLCTNLIKSTGVESKALHFIVAPIIQYSCNPDIPAHIHLIEDGLELWGTALIQTGELDENLLKLFGVFSLLFASDSSGFLAEYIKIAESYFLLGIVPLFSGPKIHLLSGGLESNLVQYENQMYNPLELFFCACTNYISSNKLNIQLIYSLMNMLDLVFAYTSEDIYESILNLMNVSGLLNSLFVACKPDSDHSTVSKSYYASLLARLCLTYSRNLGVFTSAAATSLGISIDQVVLFLTDLLVSVYDVMGYPKHRKLVSVALSCLITNYCSLTLDKLPTILSGIWADFLKDSLCKLEEIQNKLDKTQKNQIESKPSFDILDIEESDYNNDDEYYYELEADCISAETQRKTILLNNDPIKTTKLTSCIRESLYVCEGLVGPEQVYNIISSALDSATASGMMILIKDF